MDFMTSRKVDELGRVVIPIELRNALNIKPADAVDISLRGNEIVLTASAKRCCICGSTDDLKGIENRFVCGECVKKLNS